MVEGRRVGATSAKHVLSFGAQACLSERTEKARSPGRPPERHEVEHRRAIAPPRSCFGILSGINH
jgi:hypothetical protein